MASSQQYEVLAASVKTALSSAVSSDAERDFEPRFNSISHRIEWLTQMSRRLPRRWLPEHARRIEFLLAVRYEAQRAGLDPQMVLALIKVESNFRRYVISSAGARGYMQVMPFWTDLIGDGDASNLFDMRTNLRFGCTVLRHYLQREKGNLRRALARYNGSLGRDKYPNKVFRIWRQWKYRAPGENPRVPR